ncbi:hypothetical protein COU95_03610 [Candidatus Shapirobacteria bacterium CG10_big_fil_rev_8_21_14_0_10_40_9]|uniref:DUF5673 domain-containing protein n=1 Tax=Candidatus Shapirobacteria bacterium CG10_big_fil_rev_8_21_14_0_10_40_9 TaxID=1974888 RepID=A0A2M8L2S9_9BACT|nr:MAG: hypothetical protein COU95_03610 [Candidatus Shapirobacteria bacterium CG10_big_fil_rev_8_21_14_0_10_40_9]
MPVQSNQESTLKSEEGPVEVLPVREVKTLLSWKAPIRPFKTRNREFWTTVGSIAFLLAVILLFIKEWLLIAVIAAIIFVYYVLSSVPPEEIEHQITNRGVRFAGNEYLWEEISQFWISEKWGQKILNLETKFRFPGRLELLFKIEDEGKIREILKKYLPEETPPPSFLDRASSWLSKKVPLEIS